MLVDWLRVAEVWVGANFLFGHDRTGNFSLLRDARRSATASGPRRSIRSATRTSSSAARASAGWSAKAASTKPARCSAITYFVDGTVVEGAQRGREIGFPTANLATDNELLPPHGVYATTMTIDGVVHAGVTNIGVRPTFGDDGRPTIETHMLRLRSAICTARAVRLAFVQRLRDERAFEDVDALQAQIDADCGARERLFDRLSV